MPCMYFMDCVLGASGSFFLMNKYCSIRIAMAICAALSCSTVFAQKTSAPNIESRVEALLAKMTLDEKIGQLNQLPGDISTGTTYDFIGFAKWSFDIVKSNGSYGE